RWTGAVLATNGQQGVTWVGVVVVDGVGAHLDAVVVAKGRVDHGRVAGRDLQADAVALLEGPGRRPDLDRELVHLAGDERLLCRVGVEGALRRAARRIERPMRGAQPAPRDACWRRAALAR